MKTYINRVVILTICSLAFWSCEKDEDRVTVHTGETPTLTASTTSLVLEQGLAEEAAVTFSWNPLELTWSNPEIRNNEAVDYVLQFDTEEGNFENPEVVSQGSELEATYTHEELNALLGRLELEPGQPGNIVVRLRPVLGENLQPTYSNTIIMTVTPWLERPDFASIYMVGDATANDWDATRGMPMFRTQSDPFLFIYIGYLEAGALKILQNPGEWAPQWGSDGVEENGIYGVALRATEEDPDPASFEVPADGFYSVVLDIRNMTFAIEPYDATGDETYESIGIIGDFNEWTDPVVAMTQSSFNPHLWDLEYTFEEDTQLKFRIAENWDVNWGSGGDPEEIYGRGAQGSDNILLDAGTYRIRFNDLTGDYLFIPM